MNLTSLPPLLYILIFIGLVNQSCNGQDDFSSSKTNIAPRLIPEIIGTPPTYLNQPDPVNDSNIVGEYIRSIFQDSKGNMWFGPAGKSVARYDVKTLKYFSEEEFFKGNQSMDRAAGNSIHAIAEDHNGNLWFGTNHGVVKYDGNTFRSYTEEHGLTNTQVGRKSILVDKRGDVWVGTQCGVFRYVPSPVSRDGQSFVLFDLLPPIFVTDIFEDRGGNIWFASRENGVFLYDPSLSTDKEKAINHLTAKDGLGDNYAGGIAQDKTGNMWFTVKEGICKYDGERFTTITTADGLGGTEFWGILIEHSGIIWVTARGNTTRFDPSIPITDSKAFTVFTPKDGLNCCVQSMYQDRSGNVWWGTGQGLYRFDGKQFYQVKQDGPW